MTTQEVADKLVQLCSQGKFDQATKELYSNDIVSIEAAAPPGGSREAKGLDAILAKGEWWAANHEVHSVRCDGPIVAGSHFAVTFIMDVTSKPMGNKRFTMEEIGVYQVDNGKITQEQFFYKM